MKAKHIVILIACILGLFALVALFGLATDGFRTVSDMSLTKVNPDNLIKLESYVVTEIEDDKATGYTLEITDDGLIKISGENESETATKIAVQNVSLQATEYYFSSGASVDKDKYIVTIENADGSVVFDNKDEGVIEIETADTYTVYINIEPGVEINETFSLVLVEGSEKASFFVVK